MITGVITCALCGNEIADAESFIQHIPTHLWALSPPSEQDIRTRIERDMGTEVEDDYRLEAVMHHVEHLIATEWGPVTQGFLLDTPITEEVTEQFSLIAGGFMLAALDSLLVTIGDQAADIATSPKMLRWELKVSPLWQT